MLVKVRPLIPKKILLHNKPIKKADTKKKNDTLQPITNFDKK